MYDLDYKFIYKYLHRDLEYDIFKDGGNYVVWGDTMKTIIEPYINKFNDRSNMISPVATIVIPVYAKILVPRGE